MRKISFRVRNFDKEQFLTFNIDNNAELDEEVLDFLEEEEPEGIVPIIFEEGEEFDTFSYDVTDKIQLRQLSAQEINAEMVLKVIRGLVLSMMNMAEYRVPLSYLVLNRRYIYIDSEYKVEFVCIPLEDMKEEVDLTHFLRNFIASLRFEPSENGDYVAKLLTYINNRSLFNLHNLLELVEEWMDRLGIEIPDGESNEIYSDYTEILEQAEELMDDDDDDDDFMADNEAIDDSDDEEVASEDGSVPAEVEDEPAEDEPVEEVTEEESAEEEPVEEEPAPEESVEEELAVEEPVENESEDLSEESVEEPVEESVEQPEETIWESEKNTVVNNNSDDSSKGDVEESAEEDKEMAKEDAAEGASEEAAPEEKAVKKDKKPIFRTKEADYTSVVIEDELDAFLAQKAKEDPADKAIKFRKDIKINRASIVQNTKEELKAEEELAEEAKNAEDEKAAKKEAAKEDKLKKISLLMRRDDSKAQKEAEAEQESTDSAERAESEELKKDSAVKASVQNPIPKVNPYLIRVNTDERIMITKQTFKIGKANMGVDYTISGNGAISRLHAIITGKDGEYFIKDNKSTNHTFVNGKSVDEGETEQLTDNCKIVLGDEEFVFKLQ